MSGMSSLSIATSGLRTAQAGLYVTGHNMSNSPVDGYSRQRVIQHEFMYTNIGNSGNGVLQMGLGADITQLQQIRDNFIDITYRQEMSKGSYYAVKAETGLEIQAIIGELRSAYNAQSVISDMWDALNELSVYQPGLETRANFIATAVTFVNKANNISERLIDYQHNLDDQIRDAVTTVNQLLEKIKKYNELITDAEMAGDHANDFRDTRNNCLDELSQYLDIEYKEMPNGRVDIICEGHDLLVNNDINKLSLKYTSSNYSFVEPVFTGGSTSKILAYDAPLTSYTPLFNLTGSVTANKGNDKGILKALMVSRGFEPANYALNPTPPDPSLPPSEYAVAYRQYQNAMFDLNYAFIPKVQREFDTLFNEIVKLINDTVSPYIEDPANPGHYIKDPAAPFGLDGESQYDEIFIRKYPPYSSRFDDNGNLIPEDPSNPYSLYTIGNVIINPELLNTAGHTKLAFSLEGDVEDTRLVLDMLDKWKSAFISFNGGEPLSVDDSYKQFINGIATETNEAIKFNGEQATLITQINNKRQALSGVSLDEEMTNMLKYQHAYNASARMINVLDSMIDQVINHTGRTGLA